MRQPIFIRPVPEEERKLIEAGLHSNDAFVMRRSQILLASARGARAQHFHDDFFRRAQSF